MTSRKTPVRVLVVDDSAVMRQLLTEPAVEADPEIAVVGTAADPYIARERIKALNPDVVTLDVEMPHMDGLTFLRKIMALRPMPVVMISTLTQGGAETTLEALEIGAVDFVAKPAQLQERAERLADWREELQQKVKAAAQVRVGARRAGGAAARRAASVCVARPARSFLSAHRPAASRRSRPCSWVCPTIARRPSITQHMPPRFTTGFAERLNRECPMTVSRGRGRRRGRGRSCLHRAGLASSRNRARPASGIHLPLYRMAPPVSGHRPSVDVLFRSAARVCAKSAVAAILTGMGKDGAEGLLELAPGRRPDARPGRRIVADLRHAARGVRARRGDAATRIVADGRRHSRCLRARPTAPAPTRRRHDVLIEQRAYRTLPCTNKQTTRDMKLPRTLDLAAAEGLLETLQTRLQEDPRFASTHPPCEILTLPCMQIILSRAANLRADVGRASVGGIPQCVSGSGN